MNRNDVSFSSIYTFSAQVLPRAFIAFNHLVILIVFYLVMRDN